MMERAYGVNQQTVVTTDTDRAIESIRIRGYWSMPGVLSGSVLDECKARLDAVYAAQEKAYSRAALESINEADVARAVLAYDDFFIHNVAAHPALREIISRYIGSYHVLSLQNGIINRPSTVHHQGSWHRDLPYQNFVSNPPLAINVMFCLDPFTVETGCTWIIPFSHREQFIPSDEYIRENKVPLVGEAGSVVFFDSMLFHRAGNNTSSITRRGINNLYTTGVIRQQINLPAMLSGKYSDDPYTAMLLGYTAATPDSVQDFRDRRRNRKP